eukprot:3906833-Prymnesium_polylepis.1
MEQGQAASVSNGWMVNQLSAAAAARGLPTVRLSQDDCSGESDSGGGSDLEAEVLHVDLSLIHI